MSTALIVLAAGQGTRMLSDMPKVLHKIGGAPLFSHALDAADALGASRTILVVGHGGEAVAQTAKDIAPDLEIVVQKEQLGTGHAVMQARETLRGFSGDVVVLFGDTPFIQAASLRTLIAARAQHDVVVLGFEAADPARYGRLIMNGESLQRIVEFKDASEAERKITFCNSGIVAADAKTLFELLDAIDQNNASGEFYLTDIAEIANTKGLSATAVPCDEAETLGVNSRADLAAAEATFQARARKEALDNGVTLVAPDTVYFSKDTALGRDVTVEPNVVFGPGVSVETGAVIRAFSHLEGCHVGARSLVGPFARLRPGAELANETHIGNFVEIKNSEIGEGTKVNHLSYIGDATLGDKTNIGAGTITCNYDGVNKHKTVLGDGVFVGSNSTLVAPIEVQAGGFVAAGSTLTKPVARDELAVSRAKQRNIGGWQRPAKSDGES